MLTHSVLKTKEFLGDEGGQKNIVIVGKNY